MKTLTMFEYINSKSERYFTEGYPKVKEIKAESKTIFDKKDPNFDLPYNNLKKNY